MNQEIPVLRVTDDWIVAHKPIGIASIPESAGDDACLQARLEKEVGGKMWVVHRLDKEVSGAILYARNAAAHRTLNMAFERREVKKVYAAGAHGIVKENSGEITLPLREFGSGRIGVDETKGKPCRTLWTVRERLGDRTLLDMEPYTGRRHQLRAHAYAIGHPLIGDTRYGDKAMQARYARLLLHARLLEFTSPSGEPVRIECPPPENFQAVWHS